MLRKGRLVAALSPGGIGAHSALLTPPPAGDASAPVPLWLGGAGTWLGGRRASSLVAFLAIFTMGPLVLLSALSVNSFYTAVTAASNLRLSAASALAAAYVDTEMTALATLDTADARRPELIAALRDGNHVNYDNASILAILQDLRTLRSDNRFAAIIDPQGTFWGNEDPPAPALVGQNYGTAHDWFQGASKAAKAYVSPAYVAAASGGALVVAISAPVTSDGTYVPKGIVVGILLVGYGLSATQALFSDFARNQGMLIEVTDQKGVVVAHSGSAPTSLLRDNSAGVNAALKGISSVGRVNIGGDDVFAAYTPVTGVGWTLVARVPAAAALADAVRLQGYVIGLTIVLLVLLGAAKVILYVVLRDRQATHMALTRANSGLSERVKARTEELEGRTSELVGRSAELESSNRQLIGRTAELETSNNNLVGRTAQLVSRSAELETSNNQLVGRTAQLVSRSAELEASNNQLVGRTAELVGRTAELEASNTQLAGRTAELVGRTAELETSNNHLVGRTAELEASNRELEAFGYSVSHDLRSPLRSIDGFSRLVLEENKSELSAEGVRRLGLIRAGAQQMGVLIDDLLSFSRLGRVELKKRRVFTVDVVNEVIAELKQENPDRQIEFVVQALPACLADPVLLKQVFRNLLGNAVKFSRTRSDARIEVGSDAGTATAKPGMVMYFIKDNGVGFDMQYIDKLFGVFQRLHRMEDFPGTGVGLALIRRIVERHGGTVWAEGVVDSGATFYLTLEDGNARA
jgi:signal transduction histidine kinase